MGYSNQNIKKLCGFYVSDWHLVTMLLPYINKEINEGVNITTILEKDIAENVQTLVKKLSLKKEEDILNLNWEKSRIYKYEEINKKVKELAKKQQDSIIVVNGTKEYIDHINEMLKKSLKNISLENQAIKIIDFYEVTEFNYNIMEILDKHDKIINTSGEKEIEEVFEGYKKAN